MATTTAPSPSPSTPTLQPCEYRRCAKLPSPPNLWKKPNQVIKARAISHRAATAGRQELVSVTVTGEEGDKIRRLQNGPDVRGVALDGEKGRAVDLTPQAAEAIAQSFGEWLREKLRNHSDVAEGKEMRVSVGRDPRLSGPRLSAALFAGLARAGCSVFDMGIATTPACFMSTILPRFSYDASIMMTASHLPYTWNGLKFFTKRGGLTSREVEGICDRAARKYVASKMGLGDGMPPVVMRVDFMSAYAQHLRSIIKERVAHPIHYDSPLKGFKVLNRMNLELKYVKKSKKKSTTMI